VSLSQPQVPRSEQRPLVEQDPGRAGGGDGGAGRDRPSPVTGAEREPRRGGSMTKPMRLTCGRSNRSSDASRARASTPKFRDQLELELRSIKIPHGPRFGQGERKEQRYDAAAAELDIRSSQESDQIGPARGMIPSETKPQHQHLPPPIERTCQSSEAEEPPRLHDLRISRPGLIDLSLQLIGMDRR
jgi:hypothetical protein